MDFSDEQLAEMYNAGIQSVDDQAMTSLCESLFRFSSNRPLTHDIKMMLEQFGNVESIRCLSVGLSPRAVRIVILRFGLNNMPKLSLGQIAEALKISIAGVQRVEDNALRRMRRTAYERIICDEIQRRTNVVATPIHTLALRERRHNALRRAQILTLEQLVQYSPNELLQFTNIGPGVLDEIMDKLEELGMGLNEKELKFKQKKR